MKPYIILEVANTHAGDKAYVFKLLEEYLEYKNGYGIKFQPFKYDEIARQDYEWYPVYKTLFFDEGTWKEIITKASLTKEVWIDVSNAYSVKILNANLEKIRGIKFQASILDNISLINDLKKVDLSEKTVIINIASLSLETIKKQLNYIKENLGCANLVLQVGFQDYPTQLIHSGISKFNKLKSKFNLPISFADHIDGTLPDALDLPVHAINCGATIVEKHVMCSGEKAKYDHFSSLSPDNFKKLVQNIGDAGSLKHKLEEKYAILNSQPFVNDREMEYYKKTAMKPTMSCDLQKGQIVSLERDVDYKRTNEEGLDIDSVRSLNKLYHVLAIDKKDGQVLKASDFKKAKIANIIAGRLKSSRLPKKAILSVGDMSSVELCIKNAMKCKAADVTILATSTLEEDSELKNYTYHKDVVFHTGHPEDVIERYLTVINKLDIDVFIRITADMPYVSEEIVNFMLESHFETGADYTAVKRAAVGQGVQIINAAALRKVRKYFPVSDFSEYMNAYIIYNPKLFKINEIELPENWIRDYRLTLDYQEDLDLIRKIEEHFKKNKLDYSINELFKFLDANPEIAYLNKDRGLIYKVDPALVEKIKRETTYVG